MRAFDWNLINFTDYVLQSTNWKIRFNKRAGSRPGSKKPSAVEVTKSKLDQPQSCCSTTTQNIFKPMCEGGCLAKLSLPFAEKREFVNVGDTILHVLPCTTAWDDECKFLTGLGYYLFIFADFTWMKKSIRWFWNKNKCMCQILWYGCDFTEHPRLFWSYGTHLKCLEKSHINKRP